MNAFCGHCLNNIFFFFYLGRLDEFRFRFEKKNFHVSCCYVKKKNGAIENVTNVSCVYCLLENFAAASCAIGRE